MRNRASTVTVVVILGLAATPLAYHMLGGRGAGSFATTNWARTLHGGSAPSGHGRAADPSLHAKSSAAPAADRIDGQDSKSAKTGVAGTWTMTVSAPNGTSTMALKLEQDGRKVTGTFTSPHGEAPVKGEFADGKLTCSATLNDSGHESQVSFAATLKDDGTLAGTMTSEMGEMPWTATRAKAR